MKAIIQLSFIAIIVAMISCATVNIRSEHDPNVDFATYKTWNFPDNIDEFTANVIRSNPFVHKEMLRIIEDVLVSKGYMKAEGVPDMFVVYMVSTKEKTQVSTYSTGWDWGYHGWDVGYTDVRVDTYTEGTLVIDMIDADEEELIWRGWATGTIKDRPDVKRLEEVVKGMLAEFPPK